MSEYGEYERGYEDCHNELFPELENLRRANTSMMRLIQLNDQKTALMEASPEFAEAMNKISE